MINHYIKAFRFVFFPLYWLSFLMPRKKHIWLFGDHQNRYSGNAKSLFLYASQIKGDVSCIWITSDFSLCKRLCDEGHVARMRWSFRGLYYCLIAKFYFYNVYSNDINYYTSGGATMMNLWHGIPLKHVEFDVKQGAQSVLVKPVFSLLFRFLKPDIYKAPDYVLSTSDVVSVCFSTAFRVPKARCLPLGYPRCDFFFDKEKMVDVVDNDSNSPLNKKIVYMPTWRNTNKNFIHDALPDLKELNAVLQTMAITLYIKLHPNTNNMAMSFSNIEYVDARVDAYELLQQSDVLITDYSSVFFDYLLLDKEIIFYPFDMFQYHREDRAFYFDYEESTPGKKVYDFFELLACLKTIDELDYSMSRQKVRDKFWSYKDGHASQRIYDFFSRLN